MKRTFIAAALALSVAALAAAPLLAETSVGSSNIGVTATVLGVNTLSAQPRLISNDNIASGISFTDVSAGASAWNNRPLQYVQLSVNDNATAWRLRLYTNNFDAAPSTTAGYQFGGMVQVISTSTIAKAPMGWMVLPDTGVNAFGGPNPGNPACGAPEDPTKPIAVCEPDLYGNGWTYVKDLRDVDDPTAEGDSSFGASDGAGYTNVAFGAPSFTRIVRPNVSGGNQALDTTTAPFYLYSVADFSGASAGSYSANLVLELLNE